LRFEKPLTNIEKARAIADIYSGRVITETLIRCNDFYEGTQEAYIPKIGTETNIAYNKREKLWINFTRPIIEKRASVYESRADRKIEGIGKDSQEMFEDTWERSHSVFQEIDLYSELSSYCCVYVYYDQIKKEIKYTPYKSQYVFPYVDETTGLLESLCLRWITEIKKTNDMVETIVMEQVWDKEQWVTYEDGVKKGEGINIYGELPFVFFYADPRTKAASQYFNNPPAYDVVDQNYHINSLLSDLKYVCQFQSFGQLVVTVNKSDKAGNPLDENNNVVRTDNVKVGLSNVIILPEGGKAEFIHPDAAIGKLMEVIAFVIDNLFTTSSVPKVTIAPSPTMASGVSLVVQWYPLVGVLNKKRSSYRLSEEELVDMTLLVHDRSNEKSGEPSDYEFTLNFDEGTIPKSAEEQMNVDRFELEIGIASPVEILRRKDPDLSEEEAIEQLKQNEEWNREILAVRSSLSTNENDALDKKLKDKTNQPPIIKKK